MTTTFHIFLGFWLALLVMAVLDAVDRYRD